LPSLQNNGTSNFELTVPTLAVFGENSYIVDREDMIDHKSVESIRLLAKNVSDVVIPFSGHWIPEEQPGFLSDPLVTFFKDNDTQSSSLASTNETVDDLTGSYNVSKDQTSNITHLEKQNYSGPANQMNASEDVKSDTPIVNLTGNATQKQATIDSTAEERVKDQETPLSVAIEAIRKLFGS